MVFAIDPGLVRTGMSESGLTCGEPSIEEFFKDAFANHEWGMTTLGASYTRTLRTVGDQRLVQDGPYRLIRHPGYSGSLLVWAGYSPGLGSWIALVVTAGLLLAVYSWRINAEESMLLSTFGEQYAQYRRHTKRLIPFLY